MIRTILSVVVMGGLLLGQQQSPPKVKVNMINVCTPSPEEQQEIASALAKIPRQPLFSDDFEVDRGRTHLTESPNFLQPGSGMEVSDNSDVSDWVRIRREFSVQAMFSTVQYSFSVDGKNMVETLVFRVRDPKDLVQISIEYRAAAVTSPAAMLATGTPASRIKLERFGKSSVALARCNANKDTPAPDQSAYEPLFQTASGTVSRYRSLLAARETVPQELEKVKAAQHSPPLSKKTPHQTK